MHAKGSHVVVGEHENLIELVKQKNELNAWCTIKKKMVMLFDSDE